MSDIAARSLQTRTARSVEAIRSSFIDNLFYLTGRTLETADDQALYMALAYTVRDRLLARFIAAADDSQRKAKTVAYLSAEFLIGPQLGINILNLGIWDNVEVALEGLGLNLEHLLEAEEEPGLGNGGLGRLAACYLDSLATLEVPAIGYGIRYEYGIFDQEIRDGWQVEVADNWLRLGNPWELPNRHCRYPVKLGGHSETYVDELNRTRVRWTPQCTVYGVAYDIPVLGFGMVHVNLLRLWKSEAREAFDLQAFNHGDYYGAVEDMVMAENLSKVLYPNDDQAAGKELRLRQQYFFVTCSLQDMIRITLLQGRLEDFPQRFAAQLNDTHPAIAIAEFMRLLVDDHHLDWNVAWGLTRQSFAYTNHTLLPEALETWPLDLFQRNLPRHLEIIYRINSDLLDEARMRFMGDEARIVRLSLIDETHGRRIRMANLACVGSHAINGVAALHSELLKDTVLADFHALWPEKFSNKTNGVSPRRFLALANRPLAHKLDETIDHDWLRDLAELKRLEPYADETAFHQPWARIKRRAKAAQSDFILAHSGVAVDPDSLFDIQAKRIHEYKRPHLNLLHIISLYLKIKHNPNLDLTPRTFIFAGKAAPGYRMAKLIIKLIHAVADVVNRDPISSRTLKVAFVPDFNVQNAQRIYPAADLSEQISTAGLEASGTGNMKFALNGALTLGTLDGANIEMRDAVGHENFFHFGHDVEGVRRIQADGYQPRRWIEENPDLYYALDLIASGLFNHGDSQLFAPLLDNLWNHDPYLVCADFADYARVREEAARTYQDPARWTRMAILNVARMGHFSSDRSVAEYCRDIWNVEFTVPEKWAD